MLNFLRSTPAVRFHLCSVRNFMCTAQNLTGHFICLKTVTGWQPEISAGSAQRRHGSWLCSGRLTVILHWEEVWIPKWMRYRLRIQKRHMLCLNHLNIILNLTAVNKTEVPQIIQSRGLASIQYYWIRRHDRGTNLQDGRRTVAKYTGIIFLPNMTRVFLKIPRLRRNGRK